MLQAVNLRKSFGTRPVLDDAGFTIHPGERVGLVGRNGSGKTTLMRMITGEERPDSGTISVPNGYRTSHLSQHIHFKESTVLGEACLALRQAEDGRDETWRVKAALHGLGFTDKDFDADPHGLSGGFQVRLNLAKALVSEPDLLLLDEPTNYLDIVSIRWLAGVLRSWPGELLLITHDREFMDSVTTHTMGIHRGKIRKIQGPTEKLYAQILEEEELYERTRMNDENKRREAERFINRFRAQATRASAVQSRIKALEKKGSHEKLAAIKDLEFGFNPAPFRGKVLMEARGLTFSFSPEARPLIQGLDLTVKKGDRIAVIGRNGKGKTTLLNLLAGELEAQEGTVDMHPDAAMAYFGQTNIDRLHPGKTVEEEILEAHPGHSRKEARTICGAMLFEGDDALKKILVLSGGERSRVLLGKLLVSPANLLLLDEPTNHLDMQSVDSLLEAISGFEGAVIIVTHSEMILKAVAERLVVFDRGEASVFEGTYGDFLVKRGWEEDDGEDTFAQRHKEQARPGNGSIQPPNKKDLRRLRADIITERSRVLTPLKERIAALEDEIMALEARLEEDTRGLLGASRTGDAEAIRDLSRSTHEARERIEALFLELEAASDEHDAFEKDFEKKLGGL